MESSFNNIQSSSVYLFTSHGSKSRWSVGSWDCPAVQDGSGKVQQVGSRMDPQVRPVTPRGGLVAHTPHLTTSSLTDPPTAVPHYSLGFMKLRMLICCHVDKPGVVFLKTSPWLFIDAQPLNHQIKIAVTDVIETVHSVRLQQARIKWSNLF